MIYSMFTLGEIEAEFAEFGVGGTIDRAIDRGVGLAKRGIGAARQGASKAGQVIWATSKRGVRYARKVGVRAGGAVKSGAKTAISHVRSHKGKYAAGAAGLAVGAGVAGYLANRRREEYSCNPYLAEFAETSRRQARQARQAKKTAAMRDVTASRRAPSAVPRAEARAAAGIQPTMNRQQRFNKALKRIADNKSTGGVIWATSVKGKRYARRVGPRLKPAAASSLAASGGGRKGLLLAGAALGAAGVAGYLATRQRKE